MAQDPAALAESDGLASYSSELQTLFADPPAGALETSYYLETSYVTLPNKLVFAKATTSASPARVFQVGAETSYKVVNWTATRTGCPPKSPQIEEDDDWTLLHRLVSGASPSVGVEGVSKKYQVSGTYVYVRTNALTTSDSLPLGVPPIYSYSQESATLESTDFGSVTS